MFGKKKSGFALALATLVAVSGLNSADAAYISTITQKFGMIDPSSGVYTDIGTTTAKLGGLGFAADGLLYGLGEDSNGTLYRVNPLSGTLTAMGQTGLNTNAGIPYTMGNVADGTLYAYLGKDLYQIDYHNGSKTLVGSFWATPPTGPMGALQGNNAGSLFLSDGSAGTNFYSVNPITGLASVLSANSGLGNAWAMAFESGAMYAYNTAGNILSVNLATGAGSQVSTYDVNNIGRIYAAAARLDVPEPSTLSLIVLGFGLSLWTSKKTKTL
jgi:hypothetical protein